MRWDAALSDRGLVLEGELDSLANNTNSALGDEVDNDDNKDQYGMLEVLVEFATTPTTGAYLAVYQLIAPGGTYEDGGGAATAPTHAWVANLHVPLATGPHRLITPMFWMKPAKTKFFIRNATGVAMVSSGSSARLFTGNDGDA